MFENYKTQLRNYGCYPNNGRRFHVSDCKTLEDMKSKKRFDRYIVTNDLSGQFKISGFSKIQNETIDAISELYVCKNCLDKLNYKNYKLDKNRVFNEFKIEDFFESYSTLFTHLPKLNNPYKSVYTKDWEDISQNFRISKNYLCESCNTSFINDKNLLHTHHINGIKNDNNISNLKALCLDCHRKEPNHSHLMVNINQLHQIYKLRRKQNKIKINDWSDVFKFTDLALHGYLYLIKKDEKIKLPEVGYIVNKNNKEIILDLVWRTPTKKIGVVANYTKDYFLLDDWEILTLNDAIVRTYEKDKSKLENKFEESKRMFLEENKKALDTDLILNYTKKIENKLELLGGKGRGLHEKLSSVEEKISTEIIRKIRKIASIRNKKMHRDNFEDYNIEEYKEDCLLVLSYLEKL